MSVDPGEGYRLLKVGERIEAGDEFAGTFEHGWFRISNHRQGEWITVNHCAHRRRLPVPTGIEAIVCADIAARQRLGTAKYGTTVKDNPLSLTEWLRHAYEECLDQAVYLRRAIDEIR